MLSLASDVALGTQDDPQVLQLAAEQERILVTRNSRDFAPLLRGWSEERRHHSGCILIWTLAHNEFGAIVNGITKLLREHPEPHQWKDLTVAL